MGRMRAAPAAVAVAAAVLVMGGIATAQQRQQRQREGASVEEPREVTISVVISALKREARQSLRRGEGWPRREADFAAEKNWTLPNEPILRMLTRRTSQNPALDGYVKWQLLSFGPDLSRIDTDMARRIVANMPKPLEQPEPQLDPRRLGANQAQLIIRGGLRHIRELGVEVGVGAAAAEPRLSVVTSGSGISIGGRGRGGFHPAFALRVADQANRYLDRARERIDRANRAILAYRDQVIQAMPRTGGLRLAVMLKDVRQRLEAGDPTTQRAFRRVVNAAEELAADPSLSASTRRELARWARTLGRMERQVADYVEATPDGRLRLERAELSLAPQPVKRLIGYLEAPAVAPAQR